MTGPVGVPSGPVRSHPARIAWFHGFSGVAGDMALAACLDAGAPLDEVTAVLRGLDLTGWSLRAETVLRAGLRATHVQVSHDDDATHRSAASILELLDRSDLPQRVRARARATFSRLAEVEGRRHDVPPADVHFHEVGGVDAIIDIVGTCAALEILGVDVVTAGPVATGTGSVTAAHGTIPVPAPAVVELLTGAPVLRVDVPHELTTPTGAALLSALAESWGPIPAMTVIGAGYGAGTRELPNRPNVVQLVVGERHEADRAASGAAQPLVELAVNVDDVTGEMLAHAVDTLLSAGAADVWVIPVLMKKGRPGHIVTVLCDQARAGILADLLTTETGSFGVRAHQVDRWPVTRTFDSVDVDGLPVRVKISPVRTKVEHDDAADVARRTGRPLREVVSLAEEAARRRHARGQDIDPTPDEPA